MERNEAAREDMCQNLRYSIQVTYNIFAATVYMTKQDNLKVTNRDVHQVE